MSIPSWPASSRRPTKGEIYVAPAFAANIGRNQSAAARNSRDTADAAAPENKKVASVAANFGAERCTDTCWQVGSDCLPAAAKVSSVAVAG